MITRFPPSPTGLLHVGGLRTALFCYLIAKKENGVFTLRIEDTDRNRLVEGGIENIISSLAWAGITADEGVWLENHTIVQKGERGPYIQSERLEMYAAHVQTLLDAGHAYYAFDTKEELDQMRKTQETMKQATRYDRNAMKNSITLGEEEAKKKVAAGEPHVVRMKMPLEGDTSFDDVVRGVVRFENALIDDQILLKADGYPTYHLANVVDDHLMGVTHVIRGEEWLSSTPKHVVLYDMFGWNAPVFAHLPLLVNEKKQKLSKRHGDVSVQDFKEKGYLPEAMVNFVALLGWNPGTDQEIFNMEELVDAFNMEQIGKSPSVFDREKLNWFNKQYMMNMNAEELAERARPFFQNAGLGDEIEAHGDLATVVALEQGRAETLLALVEEVQFVFAEELQYDAALLVWKKSTAEDAKTKLAETATFLKNYDGPWVADALQEALMGWIKEKGYGNGDVLWPMRVALSGKKNSPGPFDIAFVLGKEEVLNRLARAIKCLN